MRLLLAAIFGLFLLNLSAQHQSCGTSDQDQLLMEEISRIGGPSKLQIAQNREKVYIPIAFHIVKQGNGTGGVKQGDILKQLCKLNKDYAPWDIAFYSIYNTDYPVIRSDQAYSSPRDYENNFNNKKHPSALNVFVTGDIGDSNGGGGGVILGYYSPSNDLIVCRLAEFNLNSFTLTHEIGHFFSLRHTFFGWDCTLYNTNTHGNPCEIFSSPCNSNVPVELVDRSNCDVAGDEICDTPPDYNFAFGPYDTGCGINLVVKDSNGEGLGTMYNNVMSYHSQCSTELFTQGQIDRVLFNYNRATRDFLKSNYVPNETEITNAPIIITPIQDSKVDTYDGVYIEWIGDENADNYLIEFKSGSSTLEYYTTNPYFYATELAKNTFYFFKVYVFNDGFTCMDAVSGRFQTGTGTTNTLDQALFSDITIAPNPAQDNLRLNIDSSFDENVSITITNLSGKTVKTVSQKIYEGNNKISIDITNCKSGIHFTTITTSKGRVTQKISVVK